MKSIKYELKHIPAVVNVKMFLCVGDTAASLTQMTGDTRNECTHCIQQQMVYDRAGGDAKEARG